MSASASVLQLVRAHCSRDERAFASAAMTLGRGAKSDTVKAQIADYVRRGFTERPITPGYGGAKPFQPLPKRVEASGKLHQAGKLFEVRKDTGEVLFERPLNADENQPDLFPGDVDDEFGGDED